jgi:hypothetical protein
VIRRRSFDPRSIGGLVLWLDDSQAIGQWSAKIGSSATQNATNNQPAVSSLNARPALSFDGINDTLAFPTLSLSGWHAFAVVNPSTASSQTVLYIASSGTQSFSLTSSATGLAVLTASGSPATSQAFYGVDSRVGAGWNGGALKGFYSGLIGEILVYNAALSGAQSTAVNRYLSSKWGI